MLQSQVAIIIPLCKDCNPRLSPTPSTLVLIAVGDSWGHSEDPDSDNAHSLSYDVVSHSHSRALHRFFILATRHLLASQWKKYRLPSPWYCEKDVSGGGTSGTATGHRSICHPFGCGHLWILFLRLPPKRVWYVYVFPALWPKFIPIFSIPCVTTNLFLSSKYLCGVFFFQKKINYLIFFIFFLIKKIYFILFIDRIRYTTLFAEPEKRRFEKFFLPLNDPIPGLS